MATTDDAIIARCAAFCERGSDAAMERLAVRYADDAADDGGGNAGGSRDKKKKRKKKQKKRAKRKKDKVKCAWPAAFNVLRASRRDALVDESVEVSFGTLSPSPWHQ